MADYVKAKIAEKNGIELEWDEEYLLIPENLPFVDSTFAATDVKDAIIEAKNTGVPGPEGPQGPPGLDASRFEVIVNNATEVTVNHNFGKIPVDVAVSLSVAYANVKYNSAKFNTVGFGTGISVLGTPTKVDPSTYTREDSLDFNSCIFTFNLPLTGRIILLG